MTPPPPSPADTEAYAAWRIAVAHRLVEMTLAVAEAAQRRALAVMARDIAAAEAGEAPPAEDAPARGRREDPVAAVDRATRSVRLSLALAARLDGEEPARKARLRTDAAAEREAADDDRWRAWQAQSRAESILAGEREERVFEVIEATLAAEGLDRDEIHERVAEINERMAEAEGEWDYDYVRRPIGAVIARLAEDLGLTPDWSLWAAQDWAVEEAATGAEGSPYAPGGAAWAGDDDPPAADAPAREPVAADGSSP